MIRTILAAAAIAAGAFLAGAQLGGPASDEVLGAYDVPGGVLVVYGDTSARFTPSE